MNTAIELFRKTIEDLPLRSLDEIFEAFRTIKEQDLYFRFKNITVYRNRTEILHAGRTYSVPTEYTSLELERIRKNRILKDSIDKTVNVGGRIDNVRMLSNGGIFCLSPCFIDGKDIGHTWTRYGPEFRNIKLGSTVGFYSVIKRYGSYSSKSGINWQETSYVRIEGGDNTSLYRFPLNASEEVDFVPGEGRVSLHSFRISESLVLDTFSGKILSDSGPVAFDKASQESIDKLVFFEWLVKLRDFEFWQYATRKTNVLQTKNALF